MATEVKIVKQSPRPREITGHMLWKKNQPIRQLIRTSRDMVVLTGKELDTR